MTNDAGPDSQETVEVVVTVCRREGWQSMLRELVTGLPGRPVSLRFSESKEELMALLPGAEVLFSTRLGPEVLSAGPGLRWVHLDVAGVERSMSEDLAESEVVVTNSRGMHRSHVAQHVLGLMLTFAKRLHVAAEAQKRRHWAYDEIVETSYSLEGLTCGILGLGEIGHEVARLASAFGMRCIGTRRGPGRLAADSATHVDAVYMEEGTDDVLARSDFVVVALPLTQRTRGLLNIQRLRAMKRGAVLINVARGAIVDEPGLVQLLQEGHLGGAGLDVFTTEPLPADSPFWNLPNVVITPHTSGNFPTYREESIRLFAANLRRYVVGEPLANLVNKHEGY